jgi:hypothetical protein
VSRHHILPPIIYTPEPPKPKKTERRRGVGYASGTDEADETGETGEASEVFASGGPARTTAPPKQTPFAPVEGAERHIPSTTGKLSEDTLKELLLAQEHEQESTPAAGAPTPGWKE